ncbi:MAG TPA: basic amino acid ABC transporter substrate-binding protein [Bacillota bacterium]|nr:basic amino acid ABC transporter substrate-binding protein [Bacillota bacterium]
MKLKKMFMTSVMALSVTALAACGGGGAAKPADKPAEPAKSDAAAKPTADGKTYQVGTDAAYPPFEKQVGSKIEGFDVEILNAVADAGGFKVNLQHTGWDPLFDGIDKGKVDMGISAITINDDRKKNYDFSDPYFDAKQLILVGKDSTVTKFDDLKGKKIGVQSATTGETAVQEKFGKTYEGLKGYDDTPAAIDDLINGRVEAVVADNAVVMEYMKKIGDKGFKVIEDPQFKPEQYGIMVKKGNKEILDKVNAGLKKIKDNGKYKAIYDQYFGKK